MFGQVERTEFGFIVEHVEILVELIIMDEFGAYLILIMGKGAISPVLAFVDIIGIMGTKLLLIGAKLIQLLDP